MEEGLIHFVVGVSNSDLEDDTELNRLRSTNNFDREEESVDVNLFVPGRRLVALNRWPLYRNTFHEVIYMKQDENDPSLHVCKAPAFDEDNIFRYKKEDLFGPPPDMDAETTFTRDEIVHIRMRNREGFKRDGERKKMLDGNASRDGVWVLARFVETARSRSFIVEYQNWDLRTGDGTWASYRVDEDDIRKNYTNSIFQSIL